MKQYKLKAALTALSKEPDSQKSPKAKRILAGVDAHLRAYHAARKIDNAAIGAVAKFRSQEALLLFIEKQLEQAQEVVVLYEAGPLGYVLYRTQQARGISCYVTGSDSTQLKRLGQAPFLGTLRIFQRQRSTAGHLAIPARDPPLVGEAGPRALQEKIRNSGHL